MLIHDMNASICKLYTNADTVKSFSNSQHKHFHTLTYAVRTFRTCTNMTSLRTQIYAYVHIQKHTHTHTPPSKSLSQGYQLDNAIFFPQVTCLNRCTSGHFRRRKLGKQNKEKKVYDSPIRERINNSIISFLF